MLKSIKLFKRLIIFALVLVFASNIFPQQGKGFIKIISEKAGVEVFLDSIKIGTTPLSVISVNSGKHILFAPNPNRFLWGQVDFTRQIDIHPKDTMTVQLKFPTVLVFRSIPDGAEIYLKDKLIGNTPLYFFENVEPGTEFIIKKKYYYPETVTYNENSSAFFDVRLNLNEDEYRNFQFSLLRLKKKKNFYKNTTYSLWTVSLISGLGSIYFKQIANQNYHDYLHSASLNKMEKYYNNSLKFDNLSNIGIGIFQATLFLSFYTFYKSMSL